MFISSQGACLSLLATLTYKKKKLGGVICCSGQLMLEDRIPEILSEYAKTVPILVLHGRDDDRIKWEDAKRGFELLKKHGIKDHLEVIVEDGVGHTLSTRGLHLMLMFIIKNFKL